MSLLGFTALIVQWLAILWYVLLKPQKSSVGNASIRSFFVEQHQVGERMGETEFF